MTETTADFTSQDPSAAQAVFRLGRFSTTSVARHPLPLDERSPPAWQLLSTLLGIDSRLEATLIEHSDDPLLEGWETAFHPFPIADVSEYVIHHDADFSDARLIHVSFPHIRPPYHLPWVPLPPPQRAPTTTPHCPQPADLFLRDSRNRVQDWFHMQLLDLLSIELQLRKGITPADVQRNYRPSPMAVGQTELAAFARGVIWDCRRRCCSVLDFSALPETHLDVN